MSAIILRGKILAVVDENPLFFLHHMEALCSSLFVLQASRSSGRVHSFGKREQSIKRNPNVPVVVRGWLYKQVKDTCTRMSNVGSENACLIESCPGSWSSTEK